MTERDTLEIFGRVEEVVDCHTRVANFLLQHNYVLLNIVTASNVSWMPDRETPYVRRGFFYVLGRMRGIPHVDVPWLRPEEKTTGDESSDVRT